MAEELILRTNEQPTYWNKEAVIGIPFAFPLGTIVGAVYGKHKMENEKKAGKVVSSEPSFWNKDTLVGAVVGGIIGSIGAALVAGAALVVGSVIAGGPPTELAVTTALQASAWLGTMAGTVGGAFVGGKAGEQRQRAEFQEAKQQALVEQLGRSPELAQAVELAQGRTKEWGKTVQAELSVPGHHR